MARVLRFYRILYHSILKYCPMFDFLLVALKLCIELDSTERINVNTRNDIWDFLTRPSLFWRDNV